MAYENTSYFKEGQICETDQSNYLSLTTTREDEESYSQVEYGKNNAMVKLSSVKLDEAKTEDNKTLPNTITQSQSSVRESDDTMNTSQPLENTFAKSNIKLILLVVGMVALATVSSAITAVVLKQVIIYFYSFVVKVKNLLMTWLKIKALTASKYDLLRFQDIANL